MCGRERKNVCVYPEREAILGLRTLGKERCSQIKTVPAQGAAESDHSLVGQGEKSPGGKVSTESN